jgi:hypothetical protein
MFEKKKRNSLIFTTEYLAISRFAKSVPFFFFYIAYLFSMLNFMYIELTDFHLCGSRFSRNSENGNHKSASKVQVRPIKSECFAPKSYGFIVISIWSNISLFAFCAVFAKSASPTYLSKVRIWHIRSYYLLLINLVVIFLFQFTSFLTVRGVREIFRSFDVGIDHLLIIFTQLQLLHWPFFYIVSYFYRNTTAPWLNCRPLVQRVQNLPVVTEEEPSVDSRKNLQLNPDNYLHNVVIPW